MKRIQSILAIILGACVMLAGCQESETPYNNIPTVETGDAIYITATGALLSARLENKPYSDNYTMLFLLSTSPDMSDAWEKELWGSEGQVGGLTPNTTYYYMAVLRSVVNGNNYEVRGEVKSFTTLSSISLNSVSFTDWNDETELVTWDMLGTSLTNANHVPVSNKYVNMYTTRSYDNVNDKDLWKLPYDIMPPTEDKYVLCGYFPYREDAYEGIVRIDTYKYSEDVMWGCSDTLSSFNPTADLTLKHVLSRVVFSITAGENFNTQNIVTSIEFGNLNSETKALPSGGDLNITTGAITNLDYSLANTRGTELILSATPREVSMNLIPSRFGENQVYLKLYMSGAQPIEVKFPAAEWEAGRVYTYPITVEDAIITIGDVYVEDWNNNEGGDITVYE